MNGEKLSSLNSKMMRKDSDYEGHAKSTEVALT